MGDRNTILILGNYPPPYGGVPRHIEYLSPYLVAHGWQVHVLSGGITGVEKISGVSIYKYSYWDKIGIFFCVPVSIHLKVLRRLVDKLSEFSYLRHFYFRTIIGARLIINQKVQMISAYNLYSTGIGAAILSEIFSIPLVLTNFGEIYSHTDFFEKNNKVLPYITGRASRLLSMSRHCADSYSILGQSPPVGVIPYGVILSRFERKAHVKSSLRKELGIDGSQSVILFVGRFVADMGLDTLLDAALKIIQQFESAVFMIVGQDGNLLEKAQYLASIYPRRVFVSPSVSFDSLPDYYFAADIVVSPTRGDRACGSLASIEGMAAMKPVIASNIGGIPEIVVNGQTGILVSPENPEELALAISRLINDKVLANKMGVSGRRRVERLFNEQKTDEKIEKIFSELLNII